MKEKNRQEQEQEQEQELENKSNSAILAEKEIAILRFINEFGFCEIKQIMKRFAIEKTTAYLYMQILTRLELIMHQRILQNKPGVYYLTAKAIRLLDLDLPSIRKISIGIYEHQLKVIDIYLKLNKQYPEASWISERRLQREKDTECEHLPDGVLVLADGRQIAIEVELTMKSRKRLDEIITGYALQSTFKEVWYFCSRSVHAAISQMTFNVSLIKTYLLGDSLA